MKIFFAELKKKVRFAVWCCLRHWRCRAFPELSQAPGITGESKGDAF